MLVFCRNCMWDRFDLLWRAWNNKEVLADCSVTFPYDLVNKLGGGTIVWPCHLFGYLMLTWEMGHKSLCVLGRGVRDGDGKAGKVTRK